MAGLLLIYFSPYLFHLNSSLFAATGDGLKNFYTLAYYVKYDSGWWFTGMLYPYGEHVTFTDNQPLLAFILHIIQYHLFDVTPYLLGILNALVFFNLFACAFFVYKTLRHFSLPGAYSMICAILITLIAPNVFRIAGHYCLSYSSILTLTIYLLVVYDSQSQPKKNQYLVALAGISFLSGLIQPYWVIITGMIVIVYSFVKVFAEKKVPLPLLLSGLFGPVMFKLFLFFTDPVTDRPQDPWGARQYSAWFSSVFFPQFSFYDRLREILNIRKAEWEGIAFVGMAGLLFIILLAVKIFRSRKRKKNHLHFLPGTPVLKRLLMTGLLILLFAMFIPFRFGMEELFYRIPFFNQFRSLGRFAWAFYFIFCIYYSYGLWLLLRKVRASKGVTAFAMAVASLFLIWFSDLHFTLSSVKASIREHGGNNTLIENKKIAELLATSGHSPSDFQAILPLPLAAEGSEKLWLSGDWLCKWSSMPYSYQTGTPVMNCIMSRTSIGRTLNLVGLTGSDYVEKKILNDFKSRLPLLVAVQPETDTSGFILKKCREIARSSEIVLYSLPMDSLKKLKMLGPEFADSVLQNFFQREGYFVKEKSDSILYWTNGNMINAFSNAAEKPELIKRKKFEMKKPDLTTPYSLSCWIEVTPFGNKVPRFEITEYDSANAKISVKSVRTDDINHFDVVEDWVRFEDYFTLSPSTGKVEIEIIGKNSILDHFLFRPINSTIVVLPKNLPRKVYYNNFLVTTKTDL